ncbi:hypothetical protein DXG01_013879 [Tephrocybe rancida]|nr:hypothetical protein DXG01_013879 [Tephrocybe rancida]
MASRPASASTRPPVSPLPRTVNTQTTVLDTAHGRILCIADIRGRLSALNDLAREAGAQAIIHTGDFGFFEASSLEGTTISDRTLRHLTQYSPLIPTTQRTHLLAPSNPPSFIRSTMSISLLSEFPLLLSGTLKLNVPVYTVWGACEDVRVLEAFRLGTYNIENLHVLDEACTRVLDVGGVKLRLLGLGGALVGHKLFDCGEGRATLAGGHGTMWTTALQIGELLDTAQRVFDPTETRVLITHASPGREGLIAQLALATKADLTISAGLHFRYASSWNEFSTQASHAGFREKLLAGKTAFFQVWDAVRPQVEAVMDAGQRVLMDKALSVAERVPEDGQAGQTQGGALEEPAWKNCWNWNLCDAAYGSLVMEVREGRVSAELKSQGFNYAYRRSATGAGGSVQTPTTSNAALPPASTSLTANLNNSTSNAPTKAPTPAPQVQVDATNTTTNTTSPTSTTAEKAEKEKEKAEREKAKKKEKKERKEKERTESAKGDTPTSKAGDKAPTATGGTPQSTGTPTLPESASASFSEGGGGPKSPIGTPTKKQRNPWTIFIRIPPSASSGVGEKEIKALFGELEKEVQRVHLPVAYPGRPRVCYVEFLDEESMRRGLAGCAREIGTGTGEGQTQTPIEVKQATDREARNEHQHPGGSGGRGTGSVRGRGRGGGAYAARGFAAAGLTRGGGHFRGGHGNGGSGGGSVGSGTGGGGAASGAGAGES